jgi:hypothetical protein
MSNPQAVLKTASSDKISALIHALTELKAELAAASQTYIDKKLGPGNTLTLHIHAIDVYISFLRVSEGQKGLHIEVLKQRVFPYWNEYKTLEGGGRVQVLTIGGSTYEKG